KCAVWLLSQPRREGTGPAGRSMVQGRPVALRLLDEVSGVLVPDGLYVLVEVQVKLAVDDLPEIDRINVEKLSLAHAPTAEATELWRVLGRVRVECVAVFCRDKIPGDSSPEGLELAVALNRLAVGEIGDRVIALNAHAGVQGVVLAAGAID